MAIENNGEQTDDLLMRIAQLLAEVKELKGEARRTDYVSGLDDPTPVHAIECVLYEDGGAKTKEEAMKTYPGYQVFEVTITARRVG